MQYEYTIEEVNASRRNLHFTVDTKEVKKAMDEAFVSLQQNIKLPGFRKGKVPRWLLEKKYSQNIRGEVANKLMNQTYSEALSEEKTINIVGQPEAQEVGEVNSSSKFSFVFRSEVYSCMSFRPVNGQKIRADVCNVIFLVA